MTDIHDISDVIKLHDKIITEFGGKAGVLDKALLEAALERPFIGLFDGTEFFPSLEAKAAALIEALIQFHSFVDGNKRTGVAVTQVFLFEQGHTLDFSQQEIVDLTLHVSEKKVDLDYVVEWIKSRLRTRQ